MIDSKFSIYEALVAQSQNQPESSAFFFDEHFYTYEEILSLVCSVKDMVYLHSHHKPPKAIGLLSSNNLNSYVGLLAILGIGSAYVPLNIHHPIERLSYIIEATGLSLVLVADRELLAKELQSRFPKVYFLNITKIEGIHLDFTVPNVSPSDLVYILFTSGSTGKPKGVPITYRNIQAMLNASHSVLELNKRDQFLQTFDLSFDLSVFCLFSSVLVGGCCYCIPDGGIGYLQVSAFLTEQDISVVLMVPSVIAYLEPYFDEIELPNLRYSLFCGEALPARLIEKWQKCCPNAEIYNLYGPTEATVFCSYYKYTSEAQAAPNGSISIGKPFISTRFALANEQHKISSELSEGELVIIGDQVSEGYLVPLSPNYPFRNLDPGEKAYFSGDICSKDESGNYFYLGRTDFQVKVDGYRIELGEIEYHIAQFVNHSLLAVVAFLGDDLYNTRLIAFIQDFDLAFTHDLKTYLREKLNFYMIPHEVYSINEIPLNVNGKIDRKALINWLKSENLA